MESKFIYALVYSYTYASHNEVRAVFGTREEAERVCERFNTEIKGKNLVLDSGEFFVDVIDVSVICNEHGWSGQELPEKWSCVQQVPNVGNYEFIPTEVLQTDEFILDSYEELNLVTMTAGEAYPELFKDRDVPEGGFS